MHFRGDVLNSNHLKPSLTEDVHFKVVDQHVWNYLISKYSGVSIPRISVEVPTVDGRPDYVVEIF